MRVWSLGEEPLSRKWQPTPVFLPGKSPWAEEPGRLQPMRLQRVGHDWATAAFSSNNFIVFKSSVAQLCPTLCDPMNRSTPGLPFHHQLPESTQIHVHWVSDAIKPPHPLLSPSLPAPNLSQYHGLFKWVSSSHQVAKVLEFQIWHQSFQWTPRTYFL